MIDITKLYKLISISVTFTFFHRYIFTKMLQFAHCSAVKWLEVARIFAIVDYASKTTAQTFCKFGDCGLLEHLLYLF